MPEFATVEENALNRPASSSMLTANQPTTESGTWSIGTAWRHGTFTLLDQTLVSGTSFVLAVIVGRSCRSIADFGIYSLAFMLMVYATAIANSLVWIPYGVRAPRIHEAARKLLANRSTMLSLCIGLACTCLGVGVAIVSFGLQQFPTLGIPDWLAPLTFAAGLGAAPFVIREHVRRELITDFYGQRLLAFDVGVCASQIIGTLLLARLGLLNSVTAVLMIAVGCLLPIRCYLRETWKPAAGVALAARQLQRNWQFGQWMLATSAAWVLSDLLPRTLLITMHGAEALGLFAAAFTLTSIANPLVMAAATFFRSLAARMLGSEGASGLTRFAVLATIGLLVSLVPLVWIAHIGGAQVLAWLFDKPAGDPWLVTVIAIAVVLQALLVPVEGAQMALERGRELFGVEAVRALTTLSFGIPFAWKYGPIGVAYAMVIRAAVALVQQWWQFLRRVPADAATSTR